MVKKCIILKLSKVVYVIIVIFAMIVYIFLNFFLLRNVKGVGVIDHVSFIFTYILNEGKIVVKLLVKDSIY